MASSSVAMLAATGGETSRKWLFERSQLDFTPSRKAGIDADKESYNRQQAANLIQEIGQKLVVSQLCINTAIVYMHRFYMYHSFTKFHRSNTAAACLFLAAKVEEQPRKLEHVIQKAHQCLNRDQQPLDTKSEAYMELAQELVADENILLQTLGFNITVEHPHTHIVKTCTMVRESEDLEQTLLALPQASKDLAQTSYFLATNSLHLTTMCLQYPCTTVACVCIQLACKWSGFEHTFADVAESFPSAQCASWRAKDVTLTESLLLPAIPCSSEGKAWYSYVDPNMTKEQLEDLTRDFLAILEKCPSKIKRKLMNHRMPSTEESGAISAEKKSKTDAPVPSTSSAIQQVDSKGQHGSLISDAKFTNHDRSSSPAMAPVGSAITKREVVDHKQTRDTKSGIQAALPARPSTSQSTSQHLSGKPQVDQLNRINIEQPSKIPKDPHLLKPAVEGGRSAASGVENPAKGPAIEPLRRIKTESSLTAISSKVSSKEYMERNRERERLEKERQQAALSATEATTAAVDNNGASFITLGAPKKISELHKNAESSSLLYTGVHTATSRKSPVECKSESKSSTASNVSNKEEFDFELQLKPEHTASFNSKPPFEIRTVPHQQRPPVPGHSVVSRDATSVSKTGEDNAADRARHVKHESSTKHHRHENLHHRPHHGNNPSNGSSHVTSPNLLFSPSKTSGLLPDISVPPLKLKIKDIVPSPLSSASPLKARTEEFKTNVKSPLADEKGRDSSESQEGIRLKVSLRGLDSVATLAGRATLPESPPPVEIEPVKLVLSKDRLSGKYMSDQSKSSSHRHYERHHERPKHRHHKHSRSKDDPVASTELPIQSSACDEQEEGEIASDEEEIKDDELKSSFNRSRKRPPSESYSHSREKRRNTAHQSQLGNGHEPSYNTSGETRGQYGEDRRSSHNRPSSDVLYRTGYHYATLPPSSSHRSSYIYNDRQTPPLPASDLPVPPPPPH